MKHPTEAAIRLADGTVFVGNFHGHALEKAADAGYSDQILKSAELGFSHSDGAAFYQATMTLFIEARRVLTRTRVLHALALSDLVAGRNKQLLAPTSLRARAR